jgi:alpha-glucuronidase
MEGQPWSAHLPRVPEVATVTKTHKNMTHISLGQRWSEEFTYQTFIYKKQQFFSIYQVTRVDKELTAFCGVANVVETRAMPLTTSH